MPALWSQDIFDAKTTGLEMAGQLFSFADKKGRAICLIPEATAIFQEMSPQLLAGRRNANFFYIARCYRYERPQAGRYREFTQLGFEALGPDTAGGLARAKSICRGFLESLGAQAQFDEQARRGLGYYLEGQGFEARCEQLGAQKQIAGGGAYPQGAGFAIGLERLALALAAQATPRAAAS